MIIMKVKMRKVGTSNVLTVPKSIHPTNKEYEVLEGRNGSIIYIPEKKNLFKDKDYVKRHAYDGNDVGFVDAEVDEDELS